MLELLVLLVSLVGLLELLVLLVGLFELLVLFVLLVLLGLFELLELLVLLVGLFELLVLLVSLVRLLELLVGLLELLVVSLVGLLELLVLLGYCLSYFVVCIRVSAAKFKFTSNSIIYCFAYPESISCLPSYGCKFPSCMKTKKNTTTTILPVLIFVTASFPYSSTFPRSSLWCNECYPANACILLSTFKHGWVGTKI